MSGGSLYLVDRCDTERYARTPQRYGGKRASAPHLSSVPCRLITKARRGFNSVTGEWLVSTEYKLMILHDADVDEGDRITNVVYQDGTLVQENFEVDSGALPRRGRMAMLKTLMLRKVS